MNVAATTPNDQADESAEYTIDQLAHISRVTVRNIRAHQSRGLLPAPEVRGRTGFYTQEHLARLQLIGEMQADGFNLNSIKRILDGMPPGSAGHALGFERALRTPWGEEVPEVIEAEELLEVVGGADDGLARKATKLGLIVPLGDGRFEVPSPTLLRAGVELNRLGIPLEDRLAVMENLSRHTQGVAEAFVRLFLDHVWQPFHKDGEREEDWPRVYEALDLLRPLAGEALGAAFHQAMARAVDDGLEKVRQQQAKEGPRRIADRQESDKRQRRERPAPTPRPKRRRARTRGRQAR